ncbi:MAG: alpha/beta fold hydrolase [Acidobacteriota bacterium]
MLGNLRGQLLGLMAGLLAAGCSGLRPLPSPTPWDCSASDSGAEFWGCVRSAGPVPARREGAFRSTFRVVRGDLARKNADQIAARACVEQPPAGFTALRGIAVDAAPPLWAYHYPGEPQRPLVVVVHGLYDSRNSAYVRFLGEALAAHGYGVLIPDMRWHGCLLSPEWLPTLGLVEASDLLRWSRFIAPERKIGMVGFSLGALDVIHAAGRPGAPEAGVVAISPPAALETVFGELTAPIRWWKRRSLGLLDLSFRRLLRDRLQDQGIALGADGPVASMMLYLAESQGVPPSLPLAAADPLPSLARAAGPVLLLAAEDDPLFGPVVMADLRRAAEANPGVELLATPGGGHIGLQGAYPQWFMDVLDRFFGQASSD